MRGNPEAQATLDRISPHLLDAAVELMVAHELGHCRRYLNGAWYSVPAGFMPSLPEALSDELRVAHAAMEATRREEAYGDLVGLGWTQVHHPQQYAELHAWLVALRSEDLIPGSLTTTPWPGCTWHRMVAHSCRPVSSPDLPPGGPLDSDGQADVKADCWQTVQPGGLI
jgi:hypothetical protein